MLHGRGPETKVGCSRKIRKRVRRMSVGGSVGFNAQLERDSRRKRKK